jgi:hypothetical protein
MDGVSIYKHILIIEYPNHSEQHMLHTGQKTFVLDNWQTGQADICRSEKFNKYE